MAAPRVSDLGAVVASTVGKIELESVGDDAPEERIVERLITKALFTTFGRVVDIDELDDVVLSFEDGLVIETGDRVPSRDYVRWMAEIAGPPRGGPPARHVRCHGRGGGAGGRRVGGRVPARGAAPEPPDQQGSLGGRHGLPAMTGRAT